MNFKSYSFYILFSIIFILNSCSKDTHTHSDHDAISRVIIKLKSATDSAEFSYTDLDGDGGNPPTISSTPLKQSRIYQASITLYSGSSSPLKETTSEIQDESKDHQFFFSSTVPGLTTAYADKDPDNLPIGLLSTWTTTSSGSGKMKITLRHMPNKSAAGVSSGSIQNAGGETDIEVEFDVQIQ